MAEVRRQYHRIFRTNNQASELPRSVLSQEDPLDHLQSLLSTSPPSVRLGLTRSPFLKGSACTSHSSVRPPPLSLSNLPLGLSWEIGTLTEALLEYSWPQLSVFDDTASIPPARELFTSDYPVDVINIATTCAPSVQITGLGA